MNNINLNEIKSLAVAVNTADTESAEWDRATDALNAKNIPAVLVWLIEQLEAVQRERNEYRELFHANESEKQTLFHQNDQLLTANLNIGKRERETEAELARRDAAAGEPVCIVELSDYVTAEELAGTKPRRKAVKELHEGALKVGDILYTAAQPAVLPPEMMPDRAHEIGLLEGVPLSRLQRCIAADSYNQAIADAKALGCQPAPVATVPDGWKLVPLEATEGMLNAAWIHCGVHHPTAYRVMVAAAPKPE